MHPELPGKQASGTLASLERPRGWVNVSLLTKAAQPGTESLLVLLRLIARGLGIVGTVVTSGVRVDWIRQS
jgi:hypothetical protein